METNTQHTPNGSGRVEAVDVTEAVWRLRIAATPAELLALLGSRPGDLVELRPAAAVGAADAAVISGPVRVRR